MAGVVQKSVTVGPLFSTGWLLLKIGALVSGADVPEAVCMRAPLKHDASPLPPRHSARLAGASASRVNVHGDAGAAAGAAEGRVGESAQAIEPKAMVAANSLRNTRAICLFVIRFRLITRVGCPARDRSLDASC